MRVALHGRRRERQAIDDLLASVRSGGSGALVVRGAPGIGKSALLAHATASASGFRHARATGVQSEMVLAFSGLHQFCGQMLGRLHRLPGPQRDALSAAFGLTAGAAPDRFLVGLAVLRLLGEVAEDRPLLGIVEDAHWLDQASAQVLAFVGRRLHAAPVALFFAVRDPSPPGEFAGIHELELTGLADADARMLIGAAIPGRLDERVRDRIVAEAQGNPLALLELPRSLTPADLAGGFGLTAPQPLTGRIEESFLRRIQALPEDTRRLLLIAAVEPCGEPELLWRAAERMGIGPDAAAPAEADGLLHIGAQVGFRHPLVRSAVHRAASPDECRDAHRAIADALDPDLNPARRAWHRAEAALESDEEVAGDLESSADRAQARGGLAAAAAFLERAAALTPDPARRAARTLAAAGAKLRSGAPDAALGLLSLAEAGPLDPLQGGRLELLRAEITFATSRGSDAPPLLIRAARRLEPLDPRLARETHLQALEAAMFAGRLGGGRGVLDAAEAARLAPPVRGAPRAVDLLLDGLATLLTDGWAAGVPLLRRALGTFQEDDEVRWLGLAWSTAADVWDDDATYALAIREVERAREAGALSRLPIALNQLAGLNVHAGEFATAAVLIEEAAAITEATAGARVSYGALKLAAWRGREAETAALIDACVRDAEARGEGMLITFTEYATAVLENGRGNYAEALAAARQACEHQELFATRVLPEYIEAAVRAGEPELAAAALVRLSEQTQASGTEWALGFEARCRALLSDGEVADELHREAIERLGRCRATAQLARAHLLYGEWLRRERRRVEAREQLRTARDMFVSMGAEGFAARADRELLATGEHARKRSVETAYELTPQELQIAGLAQAGHSNQVIAARLFISPRTVEYHLHKVFTKLGIASRTQLDQAPLMELTGTPEHTPGRPAAAARDGANPEAARPAHHRRSDPPEGTSPAAAARPAGVGLVGRPVHAEAMRSTRAAMASTSSISGAAMARSPARRWAATSPTKEPITPTASADRGLLSFRTAAERDP
ncbi:MAG TPA: AAA family ATPase [Candidatus Dormibacteraeota bacterium]